MVGYRSSVLDPALRDDVLGRLGLARPPATDLDGLTALYTGWCRHVPFDNLRKLVALATAKDGELPGLQPDDFFTAFLAHGTGGTCWPSSEAWLGLLHACGFDARRAAATMLPVPIPEDSPHRPNHGSTIVTLGDAEYVVDTSMLSEEPLRLEGTTASTADPVVGIDAERTGDRWMLRFMPWRPGGRLACELEPTAADPRLPAERYEYSRTFSPFNAEVHARRNFADTVIVVALDSAFRISRPDGEADGEPFEGDSRRRDQVLLEEMGYSEEIVAALPAGTSTTRDALLKRASTEAT